MYVLFVIELRGRRVHFARMTLGPDDAWIRQVGRNLTDAVDGFLINKRFCLMDRDAKFTTAFRCLLREAGIESVRLPPPSPNLRHGSRDSCVRSSGESTDLRDIVDHRI